MIRFIAATLNLPSQIRGRKAGLYPHPKRTNAAVRLWNRLGVEVVALQELATMSRLTIRARRRWGLVTTTNDRFPLRKIGNGIAYRRDRWLLVGRDTIHVDTPTHKRGLRYPVVTLENRDEPTVRLVVIAVHIPTARDMGAALKVSRDHPRVVAARNKLNGQVLNVAENHVARGLPVLVAGDFNQGELALRKMWQSWKHGAGSGPDHIFAKQVRVGDDGDEPTGRITDHDFMPWCEVRLSIPRSVGDPK